MNRPHSALLLSALLMTGCSAGGTAPASQADPSQPEATPVVEVDSTEETCAALFNQDGSGLYNNVTGWLVDVESLDQTTAAEAERLSNRLQYVEERADTGFASSIAGLRGPLKRFVEAWNTRGSFKQGSDYQQHAPQVIERCSTYLPNPTVQALQQLNKPSITGDFTADLAATGFVTEDPEFFREAMVDSICVPKETLPQYQLESNVGMSTNAPYSVEALRLVVAYDCPERSAAFEEALAAVELEKAGG